MKHQCGCMKMPTRKEPLIWLLHHSANSSMISSYHLPTNYPRTVFFFLRTATRWLHRLRFHPTSHKKGIYLYFISYVYIYIYQECVWMGRVQGCVVIQEGYLEKKTWQSPVQPSSSTTMQWWESPTPPVDAKPKKKLVMIYHDESILNSNVRQTWIRWTEDQPFIQLGL